MTSEKSKDETAHAQQPKAGAGEPGAMPSINEPEGSQIHPATPGQQKPGGPQAHRLDDDPKIGGDAEHPGLAGKNGDDDDDDDGGTTRTRTTTVQTKHKR